MGCIQSKRGYPGISGECPSEVVGGHLVYEEGGRGIRGVRVPCVVVRGVSEGVRIVFSICTPASVFRLLGTSRA